MQIKTECNDVQIPFDSSIQRKGKIFIDQTDKHVLGHGHVYHCVTSAFLLTAVIESLGTEEKNCCSFESEILTDPCVTGLS